MKIIIVGASEVGFYIARKLAFENKNVVVIEKDPEAIRKVSDNIDVQCITGSGSSPVILEKAGIANANVLLAVTQSDEVNITACLIAHLISPATKKLARIRNADFDLFHDKLIKHAPYIDTAINPEIEMVKTIAKLLDVPGAIDVSEFADGRIKLVGIRLDAQNDFIDQKLSRLSYIMRAKSLLIAAIIRNEKLIIPGGNDVLKKYDIIYFVSDETNLDENLFAFKKQALTISRAMIIGGGRTGMRLAKFFREKHIHTKIIERCEKRCSFLAEKLDKAVVLLGDGSDQELLKEEGVADMDLVATLTDDDEANILASLVAKKMGAKKTITKIDRFNYWNFMEAIGIEHAVSSKICAVNSIMQYIRMGKVFSAVAIKGEQAEVLEAEALETSDIVGTPLKKITMPKGSLVMAILRNDKVIIPSGKTVIKPKDRILIFTTREAVSGVEKILTVKLEYF